jgi:ubiquinone/menaquinone biosynthesis C-methylase UbiE
MYNASVVTGDISQEAANATRNNRMQSAQKIVEMNKEVWDQEAANSGKRASPWLDLDREALVRYGRGESVEFDLPGRLWDLLKNDGSTERVMKGVRGKRVLCLASGGGQQSAVFGLLGARVSVLDISSGQLRHDIEAAKHYGYEINAVQGDMRDLSVFSDGSFDIVEHPISLCFVPSIREAYQEVFRVLATAGLYRVAHVNPAVYPAGFQGGCNGWDGVGYRIAEPYVGGPILRNSEGRENMSQGTETGEFRHLLSNIFNDLVKAGFQVCDVSEDRRHVRGTRDAEPGSEEHRLGIIAEYFVILATKTQASAGCMPCSRK